MYEKEVGELATSELDGLDPILRQKVWAEFRRLRIWALWNRLPAAAAGVAAKQLAA